MVTLLENGIKFFFNLTASRDGSHFTNKKRHSLVRNVFFIYSSSMGGSGTGLGFS